MPDVGRARRPETTGTGAKDHEVILTLAAGNETGTRIPGAVVDEFVGGARA